MKNSYSTIVINKWSIECHRGWIAVGGMCFKTSLERFKNRNVTPLFFQAIILPSSAHFIMIVFVIISRLCGWKWQTKKRRKAPFLLLITGLEIILRCFANAIIRLGDMTFPQNILQIATIVHSCSLDHCVYCWAVCKSCFSGVVSTTVSDTVWCCGLSLHVVVGCCWWYVEIAAYYCSNFFWKWRCFRELNLVVNIPFLKIVSENWN